MALRLAGVDIPLPEYRFHPVKLWRFDYAWVKSKVALEVDGGVFTKGRHTRGKGVMEDHDKFNNAAMQGWRILRCTPDELRTFPDGIATMVYHTINAK